MINFKYSINYYIGITRIIIVNIKLVTFITKLYILNSKISLFIFHMNNDYCFTLNKRQHIFSLIYIYKYCNNMMFTI